MIDVEHNGKRGVCTGIREFSRHRQRLRQQCVVRAGREVHRRAVVEVRG
jgi:hypothetical protein